MRLLVALREDDDQCRMIVRESLERASMRILARRYGHTKKTIQHIIHRLTSELPDSSAIAAKFRPHWSGVLVFDGKVVRVYDELSERLNQGAFTDQEWRWRHKMRWLCGVDHGTGDLPHYQLAEEEGKIDLVMYFQGLKALQYPLTAVVADGNPSIPEAVKFVFGEQIIFQRCTRHFIEDLKHLLPADDQRVAERTRLEELILCIQRVIEADSLEDAGQHLDMLRRSYRSCRSPLKRQLLAMFEQAKPQLTAHLLYPELHLPHTSNDAENLFRQLMLRLRTIGRFAHQRYAKDYLNAWALWRRFTPFSDCRGSRKNRNRKAPLELAGCEISNIEFLKLTK